jgi:hypothetical protein
MLTHNPAVIAIVVDIGAIIALIALSYTTSLIKETKAFQRIKSRPVDARSPAARCRRRNARDRRRSPRR